MTNDATNHRLPVPVKRQLACVCEITRDSPKIPIYSSSRSSKVIESVCGICDCQ